LAYLSTDRYYKRSPRYCDDSMFLYLVHHADAVGPRLDAQRPLSTRGVAQAAWLAAEAHARRVQPTTIWHSGKLRSRQTAEAFLRACNPSATFRSVRGLLPGDPIVWMGNALALEGQDVLIVGHIPHVQDLALQCGAIEPLPLNGMIAFERTAPVHYEERWRLRPPADLPENTNGRPRFPESANRM
jgi:phosphohistidine phosphatase